MCVRKIEKLHYIKLSLSMLFVSIEMEELRLKYFEQIRIGLRNQNLDMSTLNALSHDSRRLGVAYPLEEFFLKHFPLNDAREYVCDMLIMEHISVEFAINLLFSKSEAYQTKDFVKIIYTCCKLRGQTAHIFHSDHFRRLVGNMQFDKTVIVSGLAATHRLSADPREFLLCDKYVAGVISENEFAIANTINLMEKNVELCQKIVCALIAKRSKHPPEFHQEIEGSVECCLKTGVKLADFYRHYFLRVFDLLACFPIESRDNVVITFLENILVDYGWNWVGFVADNRHDFVLQMITNVDGYPIEKYKSRIDRLAPLLDLENATFKIYSNKLGQDVHIMTWVFYEMPDEYFIVLSKWATQTDNIVRGIVKIAGSISLAKTTLEKYLDDNKHYVKHLFCDHFLQQDWQCFPNGNILRPKANMTMMERYLFCMDKIYTPVIENSVPGFPSHEIVPRWVKKCDLDPEFDRINFWDDFCGAFVSECLIPTSCGYKFRHGPVSPQVVGNCLAFILIYGVPGFEFHKHDMLLLSTSAQSSDDMEDEFIKKVRQSCMMFMARVMRYTMAQMELFFTHYILSMIFKRRYTDIFEWKANTIYDNFEPVAPQATWFWEFVEAHDDNVARIAKLVTGARFFDENAFHINKFFIRLGGCKFPTAIHNTGDFYLCVPNINDKEKFMASLSLIQL